MKKDLLNADKNDIASQKYIKAEDAYISFFCDNHDLNEYLSTWDYSEEDFLDLAKKLENCVKRQKRYKYLYLTIFDRIYHKFIYPIKIRFIDE